MRRLLHFAVRADLYQVTCIYSRVVDACSSRLRIARHGLFWFLGQTKKRKEQKSKVRKGDLGGGGGGRPAKCVSYCQSVSASASQNLPGENKVYVQLP